MNKYFGLRDKLIKAALFFLGVSFLSFNALADEGKTDNSSDWFYPQWASEAKYNAPVKVLDTDSALGRYSRKTKEIGLKDLARIHGHLCDGLAISFAQIKSVFKKLFPGGVADRTDLRAVSKNSPCRVDAVSIMTGARINFQTLRIDNSIEDGFIIQRISTDETYMVALKPSVFPEKLAELENRVRKARKEGRAVKPEDIDKAERMADQLSFRLLNTPPSKIMDVKKIQYEFRPTDLFGERGDIINKSMSR